MKYKKFIVVKQKEGDREQLKKKRKKRKWLVESSCFARNSRLVTRTESRRHESGEQGVSPHGISYAWCRIRGLIAPPHNVNIPRQLTTVHVHARVRMKPAHSVIYGNASVSSHATALSSTMNPCKPAFLFPPSERIWANSVI